MFHQRVKLSDIVSGLVCKDGAFAPLAIDVRFCVRRILLTGALEHFRLFLLSGRHRKHRRILGGGDSHLGGIRNPLNFISHRLGHFIIINRHCTIWGNVSHRFVVPVFFLQPVPHGNPISQMAIAEIITCPGRSLLFLFSKRLFFLNFIKLRLLLCTQIQSALDQRCNALGDFRPGKIYSGASFLFKFHPLTIVLLATAHSSGKCMRSASDTILLLEKSFFLFFCRPTYEVVKYPAFRAVNTASVSNSLIDFVLRDILRDLRKLFDLRLGKRKSRGDFTLLCSFDFINLRLFRKQRKLLQSGSLLRQL